MGCSGLAADLRGEKLITAASSDSYIATFKKNVQFCVDLGNEVIRVDATEDPGVEGQVPGEEAQPVVLDYEDALRRVVRTWKECAKIADSAISSGKALQLLTDLARVSHP